jgi:hypothetical protein
MKTGTLIRSFFAFNTGFTGGIYVSAGDVNADGHADIIVGAGQGGGPHLRVFDGANTPTMLADTFAFPASTGGVPWTSGLRVGTTDLNLDGHADIIVGPGAGQHAKIRVLNGLTFTDLLPGGELSVFDPAFLGGVFVAGN